MNIPVCKCVTQGNKGKVMIDPSKFIKSTTIEQFSNGLTVSLDNKKIDLSKYNIIPMFLNSKLKVKITSNMINSNEKEITAGEDFGYDGSYEPTAEIISKINETINNYDKAWIKAWNDKSVSELKSFVLPDSEEWYKLSDQLSNAQNQIIKDSDFLGIKFGSIVFYDNKLDTLSIQVDETCIEDNYLYLMSVIRQPSENLVR